MRKNFLIVLTLILMLFSCKNVYALDNWSDDSSLQSYLNVIGTEKRYKWYKENLTDLGYSNDTNIDLNETYIDENDYIIEYTDWDIFDGVMKDNLEFRKWYTYQTIKPLRWIEISAFQYESRISEVEILVDDKKIDYNYSCGTCIPDQLIFLNDGEISSTDTFYFSKRTKLALLLDQDYPMDKIKIVIHFLNTNENNTFNVYFTEKQYEYGSNIIAKENLEVPMDLEGITLSIDENWIFNTEYTDPIETMEEITPTWYTKVTEIVESREVIKKYHYYNIEREYIDGYYKDNPYPELNLKKDENDYKIFYNYEIPEIDNNYEQLITNLQSDYSNIIPNSFDLSSLNNFDLSSLISSSSINTGINIEDLIKQQQNSFNLEDLYNNPDLSNYINNDEQEEVIKTDKSKFKNEKLENKNISKYINPKLIIKICIVLSILILFAYLINKRYRKS